MVAIDKGCFWNTDETIIDPKTPLYFILYPQQILIQ